MQFDPVTEQLLHVDLQEVSADRAITVHVAVHPVGEAAGVKEQKGILNLVLHELDGVVPADRDPRAHRRRRQRAHDRRRADGRRSPRARGRADPERSRSGGRDGGPADGGGSGGGRWRRGGDGTEPEVLTERKPKEGEEAAADDKKPKRPERAEKSEKDK